MRTFLSLSALLLTLLLPSQAFAIINGAPDGNAHPQVGGLIAPLPGLGDVPICTVTLIAPDVALTAAHCVVGLEADGIDPLTDLSVSFEEVSAGAGDLIHAVPVAHPAYSNAFTGSDKNDVAVLLMDSPRNDLPLAQVAAVNTLLSVKKKSLMTMVGYGATFLHDNARGPYYPDVRMVGTTYFQSLSNSRLNMAESRNGASGACYGDSGGPVFLGSSTTIVGITHTGSTQCQGINHSYRADTTNVANFLAPFL